MSTQPLIVTPGNRRSKLNVVGMDITVLASNAETSGYEVTLQHGDKGLGPPPHSHDWDEAFYVLKGEVEFLCQGKAQVCLPGTLVHVPGGTVHAFRYVVDDCEVLELAGHGSGAAQMFTDIDSKIPSGPPDFAKLIDVLAQNRVTVAI